MTCLVRLRQDGLRIRKTRQDGKRKGQILTSLSLTRVQQGPERVLSISMLAFSVSALLSSAPSRMQLLTQASETALLH